MKALYDVIHVRTLFHINDDVALYAMLAKTETAGEEKVKISANPEHFIKQSF